jgi:hypothetical protein
MGAPKDPERRLEWIRKKSEGMKGRIVYIRGKESIRKFIDTRRRNENFIGWNKGLTKETDERVRKGGLSCSKTMLEQGTNKGPNHPQWNPDRDLINAPYTEKFTINTPKVRKRDNYTCQLCFKPGKSVHHIDGNKRDSRMENLINLCGSCHRTIHARNLGIWTIFYQPYFETISKEIMENKHGN